MKRNSFHFCRLHDMIPNRNAKMATPLIQYPPICYVQPHRHILLRSISNIITLIHSSVAKVLPNIK